MFESKKGFLDSLHNEKPTYHSLVDVFGLFKIWRKNEAYK